MQDVVQGFRLSPQQKRLWSNGHGNAQCLIRIEGPLQLQVMRQALQMVVARHEMLRTLFVSPADLRFPLQMIAAESIAVVAVDDLSGLGAVEQEGRIEQSRIAEAERRFSLDQGPLLRVNMLTLSPNSNAILFTLPAICADSWSLKNLVHDLRRCYEACEKEEYLEEPVQYLQFSEWQNELLEQEDDDTGKNYWRGRHTTSSLLRRLPFERRKAPAKPFEPGKFKVSLDSDLTEKLRSTAGLDVAPISDYLLACWHTLLWRLTAQSDIVLGVEFAGRKFEELHEALGVFVRVLPVQFDFERDPSFNEIVQAVSKSVGDANAAQEYFDWEECFGVDESAGNCPVQFSFEEWPLREQSSGLEFSFISHDSCIEEYKLKLNCVLTEAELTAEFNFDLRFFAPEQVQMMAWCFEKLLASALANPTGRASTLDILSETDWLRLQAWSRSTNSSEPALECIHELFEQQAKLAPEATAIVHEGKSFTYAQLNARANKLARYLRSHGVGPNVIVGLCLDRSLEILVGLLGILKAGGAYLPLDPDHPPARLAYQLEEGSCPVLLTEGSLLEVLPEFNGEIVCLDRDWSKIENELSENLEPVGSSESPAYVIFTSGSTGKPKGVEITHQSLVNYSNFIVSRLCLNDESPQNHFATVSTLSADLGNTCVFPSLISGGCLHLIDYSTATDGDRFAAYLAAHPIDVLKIVPSHFSALLESLEIKQVFPRRWLILGGEALSPELLRRIWPIAGDCRILNHYGPTETTVGSLVYPAAEYKDVEEWTGTIPIGRPIANTEIYILDQHFKPVPPGVSGELCIGGAGLARGYLNRPEQTKARFIQHPGADDPAAKLYRTGDLARYLPDGNVEFLGRLDQQLKIRGYRIEPGEIENALRELPNVREAVVVAREDEPGHKQLVAYCVPERQPGPDAAELARTLKLKLPAYMVPQAFVTLKSLPLTPNGKVDRRALPLPQLAQTRVSETRTAPRSVVEKQLAEIWQDVLRLKDLSVEDNFFELGGDSILSIQIIARARQVGLAISPKQVFDHPTIAGLAAVATNNPMLAIDQGPVSGELPLLPIHHWFFERELPDPHHYNQTVLLEVKQPLEISGVERVVRELYLHHDALRAQFVREASGWRQFIAPAEKTLPLVHFDLSAISEEKQAQTIEAEAAKLQATFDLAAGPLVRFVYFDLGTGKPARLLLMIHHLVTDGVSWRILVEDLVLAWELAGREEPIELPARTTSFKNWAERLQLHAQSKEFQYEVSYWLDQARQLVESLPVDFATGENELASSHTLSTSLDEKQTHALLHEVSEAYHTQINDLLLTSLVQAAALWTGNQSLLVDLEGHGREPLFDDVDVTRTIGWFTTHFPVLLGLDQKMSPGEALRSVKEQLRQVPNRGIGYGMLRYLILDERFASLPQPRVSFNYLGQFDQVLPETAPFKLASEEVRETQSRRGNLSHLLRVNASVSGGRLNVLWTYSRNIYRDATIDKLSREFLQALQTLINDCLANKTASYTPSDFPAADLSQKDLDHIVANLNGKVEDIYVLSPMQEGMLFQSLYNRAGDAYFRQMSFVLYGKLNLPAFKEAWERVVQRHPTLRTSFFWDGIDHPVQVVQRNIDLPLEVYDWRDLPQKEQDNRLQAYLRDQQSRTFRFEEAPLMRLALIHLKDDVYQFAWNYHHILIDGWSRAIIYTEALALYEAICQGREANLENRRPYRDYIKWLRRQELTKAESFWRQKLQGFVPPRRLGASDGAGEGDFTAMRKLQFSQEQTNKLQSTARQYRLTLSSLVQGVWATIVASLAGEREVVFGTVVSGRSIELQGSESMVGPFLNTLPMRVPVVQGMAVLPWLKEIQEQQLELREFEYSPLSEIQRWSEVPRGKPLFETAINYTNYHVDPSLRRRNEYIEVSEVNLVERMHQAVVLAAEPGPVLTLVLLYDSRRFDETAILSLLGRLESGLNRMADGLEFQVGELLGDDAADHQDSDDATVEYSF